MTGTLVNTAAVLAGSAAGLLLHRRISSRHEERIQQAIGVFTLALGFSMFLKAHDPLIAFVALVAGGLSGAALGIGAGLGRLGEALKRAAHRSRLPTGERFVEGFVTASVLFCVGPMTLLGCLNDGIRGDWGLLAVKSAMDGVASLTLASAMGWGVLASAGTVLSFQGGLTLASGWLEPLLIKPEVMGDFTGTGGLVIVVIGLRLARLGRWEPADYLPAILLAPALTWTWLRFFAGA